jgi:hypothetical protein
MEKEVFWQGTMTKIITDHKSEVLQISHYL